MTKLTALLMALVMLITACGSDSEPGEEAAGASSAAPAESHAEPDGEPGESRPERIVSLNPTGTEMLFAVGAGDQVIAVDNYSYYPPQAPVVEDLFAFSPNLEMIAGLDPDLVITQGPVEGLDALGVPVLELTAAVTLGDVYSQIEQVGAATGHIADAAELVLEMQTEIADVVDSLPEYAVAPTYYHELDDTLYSVTSSTFLGHLYEMLGMENIADAADPDGEFFGYPQLNEEFLIAANPSIILLADTKCCGQSAATVGARPGWDQISAVENGRIIELDDDVASRWGPRVVDLVQIVGQALGAESVAAG